MLSLQYAYITSVGSEFSLWS